MMTRVTVAALQERLNEHEKTTYDRYSELFDLLSKLEKQVASLSQIARGVVTTTDDLVPKLTNLDRRIRSTYRHINKLLAFHSQPTVGFDAKQKVLPES